MDVDLLLFDLDDTLYPSSSGIWSLIRERIDLFMISKLGYTHENVHFAREKFFREFGTTLRGLESVHHVDPDEYLKFVHDVPIHEYLFPNSQLDRMLSNIQQNKVIFTNGDRWHSKRVTDALMISDHFIETIDILDVSPYCKPMIESFQIALEKLKVSNAKNILLIDDNLRNIQMAERLGLQTVWVTENSQFQNNEGKKIKKIEDLLNFYPEIASGQVV
ncbi:MAG: pyrimidine 5'-nucleotidase [Chloroflexi bacterium HGW-Chloroflexi-3]|nr:MAG: pyrimidine 5'-nucleotidase [Chloroflexi bacterium HGW-Chloroflexi-3]